MFVEDLADALVFLMERYSGESHINVGTGQDITVAELAGLVREAVGFGGTVLRYDPRQPDGTMRKLLDVSLSVVAWAGRRKLRCATAWCAPIRHS